MSMMSLKSGLGNVVGMQAHLMIAASQVQLGEEFGALELIWQFIDDGDGKNIAHRLEVQCSIVNTEAPCSVLVYQ